MWDLYISRHVRSKHASSPDKDTLLPCGNVLMAGQWLKAEKEWSWNANTAIVSPPPPHTLWPWKPGIPERRWGRWFCDPLWCDVWPRGPNAARKQVSPHSECKKSLTFPSFTHFKPKQTNILECKAVINCEQTCQINLYFYLLVFFFLNYAFPVLVQQLF